MESCYKCLVSGHMCYALSMLQVFNPNVTQFLYGPDQAYTHACDFYMDYPPRPFPKFPRISYGHASGIFFFPSIFIWTGIRDPLGSSGVLILYTYEKRCKFDITSVDSASCLRLSNRLQLLGFLEGEIL